MRSQESGCIKVLENHLQSAALLGPGAWLRSLRAHLSLPCRDLVEISRPDSYIVPELHLMRRLCNISREAMRPEQEQHVDTVLFENAAVNAGIAGLALSEV